MDPMRKLLLSIIAGLLLAGPVYAFGIGNHDVAEADRLQIQEAMRQYVDGHLVDGKYPLYDALNGGFKHLKFKLLHPDVVQISDFYVSCLDFVADDGAAYDIDFMVAKGPNGYHVVQDIIHAVDGRKRAYHRER
jgi:hypothetical protein